MGLGTLIGDWELMMVLEFLLGFWICIRNWYSGLDWALGFCIGDSD